MPHNERYPSKTPITATMNAPKTKKSTLPSASAPTTASDSSPQPSRSSRRCPIIRSRPFFRILEGAMPSRHGRPATATDDDDEDDDDDMRVCPNLIIRPVTALPPLPRARSKNTACCNRRPSSWQGRHCSDSRCSCYSPSPSPPSSVSRSW